MLDDASLQRGIEDYVPKKASNYPAHFYSRLVANPTRTRAAKEEAQAQGLDPDAVEEVFEQKDYVRIPQGKDVFDGPVTAEFKEKYRREWQLYKTGSEQMDGTPLEQWGTLPSEIKLRLQMLNVFTIEQFIGMPTPLLNQVGPDMNRFVAEAKRFLGIRISDSRRAEEAAKEQKIAELEAKLDRLLSEKEGKKK